MSYYVHLLVIWFTCIAHCCLHCCRSSHLPMCQSASVKSIIPMTERCFFFFWMNKARFVSKGYTRMDNLMGKLVRSHGGSVVCITFWQTPPQDISSSLKLQPNVSKILQKAGFPQPLSIHRKSPKKNTTRQALGNIAGDSPNFRDLVLQSGGKHEMIPWKNLVIFEWLNGDLMVTSCDYTVIIWWYNFDGDFIWWFTQALVEVQWN
jgi:hypothetical protein